MAEETSTAASETPAADPQSEMDTNTPGTDATSATTDTTSSSQQQQQQPPDDDLRKEVESLKAALKKANAESRDHRIKAKELDDLKAQIEAEKLSEKEKLEKQLATLQTQHNEAIRTAQERTINYEVRLQAAQLGIADPNDAVKLLDWSEIEYDDNGLPTNVQDLLSALLKAKPYLKAQQSKPTPTSGGATNPSRSQSTAPQALSWEFISKLTPQQYDARRPEIVEWLNQQNNVRRIQ